MRAGPSVARFATVSLVVAHLLGPPSASAAWSPMESGTVHRLQAVHFPVDPQTGYAVGNFGTILKTTDAGTSWSARVSGVSEILHDVHFPEDPSTGYVVGTGGTILKTTDGGDTWLPLDVGTGFGLRGVHFPIDATTGWVVGTIGKIFRTTDAGATWIPQDTPTLERLEKVQFPMDESVGFVVAELGLVLRTTDGGSAWTFSNTAQAQDLLELHFPALDTGTIVGASGTALRTTNGGDGWTPQSTGTSEDLLDVHFPSLEIGYAVGTNGTALVTTDGGANWLADDSGTTLGLRGVHFPETLFGFAVGDSGIILRKSAGADLGVTLAVSENAPDEGDAIDYAIALGNAGPLDAGSIEVTDLLPDGVSFVSAAVTQGTYDENTGVWAVGSLLSGSAASLTIAVTIDAGTGGTTIVNTAAVSASDQPDGNPANDSGVANLTVLPPIAPRSTAIEISPDGTEGWVVNPDHGSVSVFATQGAGANTLLAEIPVGREPWCLDVHPTNGEVWVTSMRDDHVYVVDASSRAVVDSIAAGFETFGVAFHPDGSLALVTASGSDEVFVVDVASRTVTHTLDVYRRPKGIVWRPDGGRAWISHLLATEYFGKLTVLDTATWSPSQINVQQVFGLDRGGYPSSMQNIALAPAPGDSILWIPTHLVNSSKGGLSGHLLTPTNIFHAVVRPVNVLTEADLNWDTYFLSEGGTPSAGYVGATTPVGQPVAVDFRAGRAYVANLQSNDVSVLDDDILAPNEFLVFPAGKAPIGIVAHRTLDRVYVANWLSRDVTVFDTETESVIATIPTTSSEVLPPQILNGKQFFYTSTGSMSLENRGACTSCHLFGRTDGRPWDFTQYGKHIRASRDWRGVGFTGPLLWAADVDETQDFEWTIRLILGGEGLIPGEPNPPLGPPNAGLSQDLDDIARFVTSEVMRPDTPFLGPDGNLTAEADSGQVLFFEPSVACFFCHPPPFYTDSSFLDVPYIKHDVGTGDPADTLAAEGFDTPSLVGAWDSGPYLHHHLAKTIEDVMTTFNPDDRHGFTSHLSLEQVGFIAEFVRSLGWPETTGLPTASPPGSLSERWTTALGRSFPNPSHGGTSLDFTLEPVSSHVEIVIYDVRGRRVRSLLNRPMTRGAHVVGWNSRDDRNRPVASGVYFARLSVDGRERGVTKMTVVQ